MTTVEFTESQVTHLGRFFTDCGDSIMDYLTQNIEEGGVEPSELKDKIKTILNTEGFTISCDIAKKTSIKDDTYTDVVDEEVCDSDIQLKTKKTKTKAKKPIVEKTTKTKKKGSSGPTGHRLYMFGIKDYKGFLGKIVEFKGSDEVEEWGQDKSSGEIHKHCFSLASKSWGQIEQSHWKTLAEEVKKCWSDIVDGDEDSEDKKFSWTHFSEEQKKEFSDKANDI